MTKRDEDAGESADAALVGLRCIDGALVVSSTRDRSTSAGCALYMASHTLV